MATPFAPETAIVGGLMIGLAVLLLFHTLGRVAGISGMISAALRSGVPASERGWRLAFLGGMVAGPVLAAAVVGAPLIQPSPTPAPVLMLAGLAVGLGTGLAKGCTSGHGVCGLSRLSARSIVATILFMAAGVLTASVLRHLPGV